MPAPLPWHGAPALLSTSNAHRARFSDSCALLQPVQQPAAAPAPPAQEQAGPGGAGIAAGAVLAAVAAFAATNLLATGPSLASLEQLAVPLDVALHNGKPTVLEFYADWSVCGVWTGPGVPLCLPTP